MASEVVIVFEPLKMGGDALLQKTKDMAIRMMNMAPALAVVGEGFHRLEEEMFSSNGGKWDWEALAPSTVEYKAYKGFPEETLWRTMSMKDSLTGSGADSVNIVTPSYAVFGTNVRWSQYHQEGTEIMPQRQIIPDEATMLTLLTIAVESYLFTGKATSATDATIANLA